MADGFMMDQDDHEDGENILLPFPNDKLRTSFGRGNEMVFCAHEASVGDGTIVCDIVSPALRKLISEGFSIFSELKINSMNRNPLEFGSSLLSSSENYRQLFLDCSKHPLATDSESAIFRDYHTVWHLCEVMTKTESQFGSIGTEAPSQVGELLMEWINEAAPYYFEEIFDDHEGNWEDHPQYWDVLITLLSRGFIDDAIDLLESHSKHVPDIGNPFHGVGHLMKTMPRFSRGYRHSEADWRRWHDTCEDIMDQINNDRLREVLRLMCGDVTPLLEMEVPWYCRAIAFIFYSKPWMTGVEVSHVARRLYEEESQRNMPAEHVFDKIFVYAMTQAHVLLILEIDSTFPSLWLPCHLLDFFVHSRLIEIPDSLEHFYNESAGLDFDLGEFHEYFILGYAQSLGMSNQSSWLIPIGYMEACARSGPFHMMEALKREDPTTSVMKATKMLNVCNKLLEQKENGVRQRGASWQMIEKGVGEVKSLIHRVIGRAKLESGNNGAALHHYCLSGKTKDLVQVANHLTFIYYNSSPDSELQPIESVLEAFTCHPQFPPQLELLAKYRELQSSFSKKNYEIASRVAVDVLSFYSHPLSIWIPVIEEFLFPLLTNNLKRASVDTRGTYAIMEKVEVLGRRIKFVKEKGEEHKSKAPFLPLMISDEEIMKFESKLSQLRGLLIQNLKKAVLEGGLMEPTEFEGGMVGGGMGMGGGMMGMGMGGGFGGMGGMGGGFVGGMGGYGMGSEFQEGFYPRLN